MKKSIFIVIVLCIGLVAFSALVLAKSDSNSNKNEIKNLEKSVEKLEDFQLPDVESSIEHPSSFFIGPQGQVRIISGEITAIGTTTPQIDGVKVWGIDLKVNVGGAKFIPAGTVVPDLKVGDKVNIKGTIDNATGVINASIVNALSVRQKTIEDLASQIRALIIKIRELQQKAGLPLTPLP